MYNPFYDIVKADELAPALATQLFIQEASPIWSDIQYPINHLIIGPRGAGKTIALRQLDHKTNAPQSGTPYVGIYVQISRLSTIFRDLFTSQDRPPHFQQVFADYLWLEILKELAHYLANCLPPNSPSTRTPSPDVLFQLADHIVTANSADDLQERCSATQQQIEEIIHRWSVDRTCDWVPKVHLPAALSRAVDVLRRLVPSLHTDRPSLFLLFDESSPIPPDCQRIINGLLHRGRTYCLKLAIRPYEWSTLQTDADRTIELNTDVHPLHMQYPDELHEQYFNAMRAVVNRILATRITHSAAPQPGWPTDTPKLDIHSILLPQSRLYAGFESVCAASSGNPQNLLSLCSCIFATARHALQLDASAQHPVDPISIPAQTQHEAVVRWSKDYEEQNPYPDSRAFCRSLLRLLRATPDPHSIGFSYSPLQSDLFTSDYLPHDLGALISSAFAGGFIRNSDTNRTSLLQVSSQFHLNRGLLPREGLDLTIPTVPATPLDSDFIRENTRLSIPLRPADATTLRRPLTTFLSTSFASHLRQQRADIKAALATEQVQCVDLDDVCGDQFLFTAIYKTITSKDITILDATRLRPYTLLEVGICAGARVPRAVICVVNDDGGTGLDQLPTYLRKLPILTFRLDADGLARLAAAIRARGRELRAKPSEFAVILLTDTKLRPRRKPRCIYVSLPASALRLRALDHLRSALAELNWTLLVEEDMKSYGANEFQVRIQCAYAARIGVIDTTGADGPDLLQCYTLGLFAGKRKPWRVLRVEESKHAHPDTFDSVPGIDYRNWDTVQELAQRVADFLTTFAD